MVHRALAEAIALFESGLSSCHRSEDRKLIEGYVAELGFVLAGAVMGKDVLRRLPRIERQFGQSWLIDPQPFEPAFAKWHEFKRQYEEFAVRGLTVNERLHAFSLAERYDQAAAAGDLDEVTRILEAVHVDAGSIAGILGKIGNKV